VSWVFLFSGSTNSFIGSFGPFLHLFFLPSAIAASPRVQVCISFLSSSFTYVDALVALSAPSPLAAAASWCPCRALFSPVFSRSALAVPCRTLASPRPSPGALAAPFLVAPISRPSSSRHPCRALAAPLLCPRSALILAMPSFSQRPRSRRTWLCRVHLTSCHYRMRVVATSTVLVVSPRMALPRPCHVLSLSHESSSY